MNLSASGFMKIRYYGFMHLSTKIPLKLAVTLLEVLFAVRPEKKTCIDTSGVSCSSFMMGSSIAYIPVQERRLRYLF
jgi:hypothetical protein